ncbi:uncharacterized protein EV154DRAFT_551663 [Mucor mucedo]|uniref:uncharacterized protein n=1 Tax=Mucor mucedo TaxID=29922 RepID=UPI0022210069|nr:uncharacterized protein EV154DRAFT_551663 [Mucor mucedo]KAI7891319.1 hypothetical protein EV154DRAFT_551663 [Mucor mucedo]
MNEADAFDFITTLALTSACKQCHTNFESMWSNESYKQDLRVVSFRPLLKYCPTRHCEHHRNTKKGFSTDSPTPSLFPTRSVCTHVDTHAVFTSTLVESPDLNVSTDMNTCFDTDLVGTGIVALAFQNCFRHWRLPHKGFLHWRRYLCCTRSNTVEGTGVYHIRGFCTGVDTCAVLARTRFRALAWQLGFALARNFAFNTALGTGVYHIRGICTGVDTRAVFASTLGAMHFLQHWSVGTDMDTCFDTDLVGTGIVALAFQNCFGTGVYHLKGFLHWRRYLCCTGSNTDEGPMEGAVAFNTGLGTYRHSLRHRFRLLAWHLLTLARNWLSILLSVLAFANGWVINEAKKREG